MSTVRIDTLRSRLSAVYELIQTCEAEIEDLHALAYDRPRAVAERVRTSGQDFALDTHGDPRARDAYRELSDALLKASELVTVATHQAIALLRDGGNRGHVTRRLLTVLELAEQITAQDTRRAEGDYVSVRRLPQPERDDALKAAVKEEKRLRRELDKIGRAVPGEFKQQGQDVLGQVRRLALAWKQANRQDAKDRRRGRLAG